MGIVLPVDIKKPTRWLSRDTPHYLLIYSMEPSPAWEPNRFSVSQEIPRILRNPEVQYCFYKFRPPIPILSHLEPVHALSSHFLKVHFNIILPYTPGSCLWFLSFRFPQQNPVYASPLIHTCYVPHPSHSSQFNHLNHIGWAVKIIKFMWFFHSPVASSLMAQTHYNQYPTEFCPIDGCLGILKVSNFNYYSLHLLAVTWEMVVYIPANLIAL
jgi:hypothetical protein